MWTWSFWKQAVERALVAAAAVGGGYLTTAAVTDVLAFDWRAFGSMMLFAGLGMFLLSVGGNYVGQRGTPSLVAVTPPPPPPLPVDADPRDASWY